MDEEGSAQAQPLLLTLAGQTLLERLVWQACRLGCRHVVLCAGPLPAAMMSALDRLRSRGVDIKLARSPGEATDHLHPDEQVMLFANAIVMQDHPLAALAQSDRPTALILPEIWGRDRFERIDAVDNWAGAALLPAAMIRETAAMLGDWAFGPTLIRRAVQQGVARVPLDLASESEADEIAPLVRDDLVGTARVLARTAEVSADGVVERRAILPWLRGVAAWIALKPVSAMLLALLALSVLLMALGAGVAGYAGAAFLLLVPANVLALLTRLVGQSGMPEPRLLTPLLAGRALWLPVLLAVVAGQEYGAGGRVDVVLLCLWLATQMAFLVHARARGGVWPEWRPGVTGVAILLGAGFVAGWPVIGLGASLFVSLAVQASLQHRLGWR